MSRGQYIDDIDGTKWISVKGFSEDHPKTQTANFAMRLTKKGRVNLHDVNKWLRKGSAYKVPLRYVDGGVRKVNFVPVGGWPEDVLRHDTPEVHSGMGGTFLADLLRLHLASGFEHEW